MHLLDGLDCDLGVGPVAGHHVLVHVERGQPQRQLVLELGREPLVHHVVAALHVQVLEGHGVGAQERERVARHERHPEQAAKVVRARPGGDLKGGGEVA